MSDPTTPLPSLTQPQREAIFDLLLLAMYADSSLKLSENERVYEIVSGLGWNSYQGPSEYAELGTARVRAASVTEAATRDFLETLAGRLETSDAKTFALAVLTRVLSADDDFDPAEESFYQEARSAFGI